MSVTFFTIPRPFVGEHDKLQRMAIGSWREAVPDCYILLLGNEPGVREYAIEMGTKKSVYEGREWVKWIEVQSDIQTIGKYRPLVGPRLFHVVELFSVEEFGSDWLCFISADIVLSATVPQALAACADIERPFIIGQRWDIEPGAPKHTAKLHPPCGVDYWFYRPGTIRTEDIPPFIISGGGADQWFVWKACTAWDMTVIDATDAITAIHVNHGYPEWPGGKADRQGSAEQQYNHQLAYADGLTRWYGVDDAPWVLGADMQLREREKAAA